MKARIKDTGEIVDLTYNDTLYLDISQEELEEIEIIDDALDYWTRLEHQAAIGAMQAYIIASHISQFSFCEGDMKDCKTMAHALVEKLKESK